MYYIVIFLEIPFLGYMQFSQKGYERAVFIRDFNKYLISNNLK